jgi:hypothetical protein
MTSRVETDVMGFKVALEKAMESDELSPEVADIIEALNKVPISIDLLRKTKIGKTLQDIKAKFSAHDVCIKTKALINKWKKDCEPVPAASSSDAKAKSTEESKKVEIAPSLVRSSSGSSATEGADEDPFNDPHFQALSQVRRKVGNCHNTTSKVVLIFLYLKTRMTRLWIYLW